MFKPSTDTSFDMDTPVLKNDSLNNYQFYPYNVIQRNERGRIELQNQDTSKYFLPAEAFIEVEGELVTNVADKTQYDANVRAGFVNNGIMALLSSATYDW